jgi:CheY-like chemotaxis protein
MNNDSCAGVLVVDDDADIREATQLVLENSGYRVWTATDGLQALEILRRGGWRPCVIILDLMMPVMDGWRFRDEQQHDARLAPIPVVVLSGAADIERAAASLRAAEHITKPISLERLLAVVHKYDPQPKPVERERPVNNLTSRW